MAHLRQVAIVGAQLKDAQVSTPFLHANVRFIFLAAQLLLGFCSSVTRALLDLLDLRSSLPGSKAATTAFYPDREGAIFRFSRVLL